MIPRSTSQVGDLDSFSTLNETGADLTRYQEQLRRERNSRTLTLRRIQRPSIKSVLNTSNHKLIPQSHSAIECPYLDPNCAFACLQTGDFSQIRNFADTLINIAQKSSRLVTPLVSNTEIIDAMVNLITDGTSEQLTTIMMQLVSEVFPISGNKDYFVDTGIVYSFPDFLDSSSGLIVNSTIVLIGAMAAASNYARDSILSNNLYEQLVDITILNSNDLAAECLLKLFSNSSEIDTELMIPAINKMCRILTETDSAKAKECVLEAFVEMTNKQNQLIFELYDNNLYTLIVQFVQDERLTAVSLHLIGNLSVAQPYQINDMINAGLFPILNQLLTTEYTSDTFWIFSNLLETVTSSVLPLITPEFIANVIEIANTASFEVKKEASFFISTLIIFSDFSSIGVYITEEIIEILVEMLGCGVNLVILRCSDSIIKLMQYVQNDPTQATQFFSMVLDSDIMDRLTEVLETDQRLVNDKANFLYNQLNAIKNAS